jgi:hypothetical protein
MREQIRLDLSNRVLRGKDIFLCHTGADKAWVEHLAERIEGEPYQDRYLGVIFIAVQISQRNEMDVL